MIVPYVGVRQVVTYVLRGTVERVRARPGRVGTYETRPGYSETSPDGCVSFPWMTYRECQADARSRGAVARFVRLDPKVQS